jgi:hypothetical protein
MFFQVLLIVSTVGLSWLGMMAAHEFGHVLHLWLTGGTVEYVVLHPLAISYTQAGENPHPLIVAVGGAFWGCAAPLLVLLAVRRWAPRYVYLAAFFAGFCLMANGAYLGIDAFVKAGDGRDLIAHGARRWMLLVFGLFAVDFGLDLWNGLGPYFGRGEAKGRVDRRAAIGVALALVVVVVIELLLSPS